MTSGTFLCEKCGGTFPDRPEAEVRADHDARFPEAVRLAPGEMASLCTTCLEAFMAWFEGLPAWQRNQMKGEARQRGARTPLQPKTRQHTARKRRK